LNPDDFNSAGLDLHDEEHHVANRSEDPENLDAKEITGIQRLPMHLHEPLPGSLLLALLLPALLRAQFFAFKRQSTPLTGGKRDPRAARAGEHDLLKNPNLFLRVVQLPLHPLVDRGRDHRDDELKGRRHRSSDCPFASAVSSCSTLRFCARISAMIFWTARVTQDMMTAGDNPPVGILLCTQKDHAMVEYDLAGIDNGLFVSKYLLELPKKEEMQRFIEEQMAAGDLQVPETK
jgi:hypothetical protein